MSVMGNRICEIRKKKGWTMEYLAQKLGVQKSAVNKWEKGLVDNIRRETIMNMAKLFDVNPVWLMGYDVPKEPPVVTMETKERVDLDLDASEVAKAYSKLSIEGKNMIRKMMDLKPLPLGKEETEVNSA